MSQRISILFDVEWRCYRHALFSFLCSFKHVHRFDALTASILAISCIWLFYIKVKDAFECIDDYLLYEGFWICYSFSSLNIDTLGRLLRRLFIFSGAFHAINYLSANIYELNDVSATIRLRRISGKIWYFISADCRMLSIVYSIILMTLKMPQRPISKCIITDQRPYPYLTITRQIFTVFMNW